MQAVAGAAVAVQDIQADVIESFHRTAGQAEGQATAALKTSAAIETWLESTDDSHVFVDMVCAALRDLNPASAARILIAPSLQNVPELDRNCSRATAAAGARAGLVGRPSVSASHPHAHPENGTLPRIAAHQVMHLDDAASR